MGCDLPTRCRPQRAWDLLLQRAPAAALAAAAAPGAVAGWFTLAATPTGARVRADLLPAVPLPERRRSAAGVGSGEVRNLSLLNTFYGFFWLACAAARAAQERCGRGLRRGARSEYPLILLWCLSMRLCCNLSHGERPVCMDPALSATLPNKIICHLALQAIRMLLWCRHLAGMPAE